MTPGTAKMDSAFDPTGIERALYDRWERAGYFAPRGDGPPYCIVIPPPNVTGSLHMGHAFQHTIMDTLIRHRRMCGYRTLWQVGTDHAGISTQMLVERQINAEGKTREELGREAFVARVWQWREQSGRRITEQRRRMGSSTDWSRERFTMDEGYSRAVREVFVQLYDEGLIYRGERLVNWDPELQTAISDLEVESTEEQGQLWHFRYPLAGGARTADGKGYVVVATTRPETMLGDTAVAVHPGDARYADLVGQSVVLPLVGREIPIIADEYVDPEFGSGCVKITPAHDFNDYEVGQRHGLPMINVFTVRAEINDAAPERYRGMDRHAARQAVVADLEAAGLVEKIEAHTLQVPRGDRSGAVIEPYLTTQWFVDIKPLAGPAIEAVENGEIEFVPKQYENMYFAWMRDIRDWTISRQQWWGHPIPAYYDDAGNVYVGRDEAEVRRKYQLADQPLRADPDVLETWFSSALWTFATLGWPEDTEELRLYHPTDVLVTGFDIIFFWVARMIMMTLKFVDEVPFRKVYVTGLVCDAEGRKMSKSKGNGLDPLDLIDGIDLDGLVAKRTSDLLQPQLARRIEQATRRDFPDGIPAYGTDALRFTFCALASNSRVLSFDLSRVAGYRNFCNKLWNASRFVLENVDGEDLDGEVRATLADRWIVSRFDRLAEAVEQDLEGYRFDNLARHLYEFVWNEYCDWYLELTKPLLWEASTPAEEKRSARRTLITVLEATLRIAHPVIPFITEALWLRLPESVRSGETIMLQPFPRAGERSRDEAAEQDIEWLKQIVTAVRNIRGEMNVPPGREVSLLLSGGGEADAARLASTRALLVRLARLSDVRWLAVGEDPPPAATALAAGLKILVPLAGVIDIDAERARLGKAIGRKREELERIERKLANVSFTRKAPAHVVDRERQKATATRADLTTLENQLAALAELQD